MVNMPKMINKTQINPINRVLTENKPTPKSKQQINRENYQKNKETRKQQQQERYNQNKEELKSKRRNKYQQDKENEKEQRRERYHQQKEQTELAIQKQFTKYYGAEAIKVLMSFKEYTELNKDKKKLWQDFNWTLKDCQKAIKEGFGDIVAIMKLEQVAGRLIRDYWETAKSKERNDKRSWNLLDYDEQQKLIRYWGYEKARIENGYMDTAEQLERQSKEYLKEIELAKYHEERGKKDCECYACEEQKQIRSEVEAEREKIIDDYETEQKKSNDYKVKLVEGECYNCGEYKKVDPDSGLCKKCSNSEG